MLQERADAYAAAFARYPASHLRVVQEQGGDVLYGTWLIGNNYRRKNGYYGEYPPSYVDRVMAMFPDVRGASDVLHAFSGSLPKGDYVRCDAAQDAELRCRVEDVAIQTAGTFALILADPPYSSADAEKYGTAMVDRRRALAALSEVTRVGGHLVWLDCVWPMFRKSDWRTVGRITLIRSTNHRVRLISIFERRIAQR